MNKISKFITCLSLSFFTMATLSYGGDVNSLQGSNTTINNSNPPCLIGTVVITNRRNVKCDGGTDGLATAAASGGTAPYTYSWSNGETIDAATGLSAGTYTINVTDNAGCTGIDSVVIMQPPPMHDSIVIIARITCPGTTGAVTVIVRGGTSPYTYSWTNTQTTATVSGLSAGIYGVSVTDSCGTTVTAGVNMRPPPPLRDTTAAYSVICNGGNHGAAVSRALGGTPPFTFSWSNGETAPNDTLLVAGNYTVTITDSCGASASAAVTITQPAVLSVSAGVIDNVSCYGESNGEASAILNGGTAPFKFSWSSGQSSDTASGLLAGTYMVSVLDTCGETGTASVTISQPLALVISQDSVNATSGCNGIATVTPGGGTVPYTYSWATGGQTTASITGQCIGTYCCLITDNNGCLQTACVTINMASGENNLKNSPVISIYPDPNNGYFMVSGVSQGQVIEAYNNIGQSIIRQLAIDNTAVNIDISNQANGIYLVRILNMNGSLAIEKKIVKTQ
jgi:hypothetical protein